MRSSLSVICPSPKLAFSHLSVQRWYETMLAAPCRFSASAVTGSSLMHLGTVGKYKNPSIAVVQYTHSYNRLYLVVINKAIPSHMAQL